nr:10861_t:CDS:1 [Entrophospora candida]
MSRTKVDLVTCYVGDKKAKCTLNPGLEFSMCCDKTLKRLGVKIDRPISSRDREMKFFREMTTTPVGWSKVSLTFNSNKKNRSIITDTEVLVVKHHSNMEDEILLGSPWFMGLSLDDDVYLQIYTARIVIDMPDCCVRTNLYIKSLKGYKNKWVCIPVDVKIRYHYENSDTSSDTENDVRITRASKKSYKSCYDSSSEFSSDT